MHLCCNIFNIPLLSTGQSRPEYLVNVNHQDKPSLLLISRFNLDFTIKLLSYYFRIWSCSSIIISWAATVQKSSRLLLQFKTHPVSYYNSRLILAATRVQDPFRLLLKFKQYFINCSFRVKPLLRVISPGAIVQNSSRLLL